MMIYFLVDNDLSMTDEPVVRMDDFDEPSVTENRKSSTPSEVASNEIRMSETEDREDEVSHFIDGAIGGSEESLQAKSDPKPVPIPHDLVISRLVFNSYRDCRFFY